MYFQVMIKSFLDEKTKKIFNGETLTSKERKKIGSLNTKKAQARLTLLDDSTEKELMLNNRANYHNLSGTKKYCIDADARNSKWRITFTWENDDKKDVECVLIEDTH